MPPRILCIPDPHCPYQHKNFFVDIARLMRYFKPNVVVVMGDMVDFHGISRHDPDPEADDAKTELEKAQKYVNKLVKILGRIPVKYCIGNHDNRIEKKAAQNHIPKAFLKSFRELFNLPKNWDIADVHTIGDISFTHGQSNLRGKTALAYGMNVVQGHYHSMLEISYHQTPTRLIWSVFAGSGADPKSLALAYAQNSLNKDAYGFTLIENGTPRIVPGTK